MKNLLKSVLLIATVCLFSSCSTEQVEINTQSVENFQYLDSQDCTDQDPKARLTNNGTVNFNLEILSIDGVLLNSEYNIQPGSVTSWKYFAEGEILFSIDNSIFQDEKVIYIMNTCMEFDMEIGSDNLLTNAVPIQL
jgi:hypothetical protein